MFEVKTVTDEFVELVTTDTSYPQTRAPDTPTTEFPSFISQTEGDVFTETPTAINTNFDGEFFSHIFMRNDFANM